MLASVWRSSLEWPCQSPISSLHLYSVFTKLIRGRWRCVSCFLCVAGLVFSVMHCAASNKGLQRVDGAGWLHAQATGWCSTLFYLLRQRFEAGPQNCFKGEHVAAAFLLTSSNGASVCCSGRNYRWRRARGGRSCARSPSTSSPSPAWCGRSTFSSTEQQMKSDKVSTHTHTRTSSTCVRSELFFIPSSTVVCRHSCSVFHDITVPSVMCEITFCLSSFRHPVLRCEGVCVEGQVVV